MRILLSWLFLLALTSSAAAQSVFTTRPDDPAAVYLASATFGVRGDGTTDDSAAHPGRDRQGGRAHAERRHRVRALRPLSPDPHALRLARRPRDRLRRDAAGASCSRQHARLPEGHRPDGDVHARRRPGAPAPPGNTRVPFPPPGSVPPNDDIPDATQHVLFGDEQHRLRDRRRQPGGGRHPLPRRAARLSSATWTSTSGPGSPALTQIGNEVEDLHFYGGRYGILTDNTSPFWPFTLIDSVVRGAARGRHPRAHGRPDAGPRTRSATCRSRSTSIREYSDQLWVKDSRFENVSQRGRGHQQREERDDPDRFRERGLRERAGLRALPRERQDATPARCRSIGSPASTTASSCPATASIGQHRDALRRRAVGALPAPLPPAIRGAAADRRLGQRAHARREGRRPDRRHRRHPARRSTRIRVLYFPTGYYIVRDTITLKPDTVLIALHPGIDPARSAGFARPAIRASARRRRCWRRRRAARNIVSGLGIFTGGINPRATGILWMAGERLAAGRHPVPRRRRQRTCRRRCGRRSIRHAGRGGGPFASRPLGRAVSEPLGDARRRRHVQQHLDAEHLRAVRLLRLRHDDARPRLRAVGRASSVQRDQARSRRELGLQRAADRRGSADEPRGGVARDQRVEEHHHRQLPRLSRDAQPRAGPGGGAHHQLRRTSASATCTSRRRAATASATTNGCGTVPARQQVPLRERDPGRDPPSARCASANSRCSTSRRRPRRQRRPRASVVAHGAVEKLEAASTRSPARRSDAAGTLYFVDHHQQRIFSWSRRDGLTVVRHDAARSGEPRGRPVRQPAGAVVRRAGRHGLLASSPGAPATRSRCSQPQPRRRHPGAAAVLPVNVWDNGEFDNQLDLEHLRVHDARADVRAGRDGRQRRRSTSRRTAACSCPPGASSGRARTTRIRAWTRPAGAGRNNLDTYGFITARAGAPRLSWRAAPRTAPIARPCRPTARSAICKPFAERGGESVAADSAGQRLRRERPDLRLRRAGKEIGRIDVPERPIQVLFGGPDRRTLFILTHHTLYAVRARALERRTIGDDGRRHRARERAAASELRARREPATASEGACRGVRGAKPLG